MRNVIERKTRLRFSEGTKKSALKKRKKKHWNKGYQTLKVASEVNLDQSILMSIFSGYCHCVRA
ncbi:hypothetical protein C5167_024458 [Papaver somniferum]|uniref:Uncharacterized protein n=1 Tax=Papaver somniferum TaxID=3469 RepID=A0A4Y7JPP6_PAPSO|nr:hypothetical protein C5167_024458 [Papaver somniferum]